MTDDMDNRYRVYLVGNPNCKLLYYVPLDIDKKILEVCINNITKLHDIKINNESKEFSSIEEWKNIITIMLEIFHIILYGYLNIHLFVKGYLLYVLRNKFKYLKRYKSLWTHSYYCETIGHISENTVKKYIENQNNH